MHIFWETTLSLFVVVGLFFLGQLLLGRILPPVGGRDCPVYLIIPVRGDAPALEQTVRGVLWLRGAGLANFTILVADLGLDSAGHAAAEQLTRCRPGLVTCRPEGLAEYIERDCS